MCSWQEYDLKLLLSMTHLHQFASLAEAQTIIEAWRMDYNDHRPHSSLGHLTQKEFVSQCQVMQTVENAVGSG
ncbi:MAG: integrase core domain-containing protein [Nitrospira sp.]|nr:integrase core domain-containing protein [Nitrospira sp.]